MEGPVRTILLVIAALPGATAISQSVVLPTGYDNTEANSGTAYPWGITASSIRVQYCYDSSHFTNQGITYPILINDLKWRTDGSTPRAGGSYSNCVVEMSTSTLDQSALSTTFAANHGFDLATVFNGTVSVLPTTGTTPGIYFVDVPIVPFYYDPSLGDLVLDVHYPSGSWAGTGTMGGMDCQIPAQQVSSIVSLSDTASTGLSQPFGPVVKISYTPAAGLYSNFTSDALAGQSPLTVHFTDKSFTSEAGGLATWAWDFDGDGIVDSTAQNPSFTYASCGDFNVTLAVTDGVNPASTVTKNAYISVDRLTANFTDQVVAPLTVQFADTSDMPANAWAWDFDGDNVVDSTAQNPTWVFATNAAVDVALTATRNCRSSTVTRRIIPERRLSTSLASNNSGSVGWTVYFDVTVQNPSGVRISSLDIVTSTTNTPFALDVYLGNVSYAGNEYNPAPWTLVGTASGTTDLVPLVPSHAAFAAPLYIPAGTYGFAMRYRGIAPSYVPLPAPTTMANGDLSLNLGSSGNTSQAPFTGLFTTVYSPRAWSGTIYYSSHDFDGNAGAGFFGQGCTGTLGVSHQAIVSPPQLGGALGTAVSNMPFALGLMAIGTTQTQVDLGFLGAAGCTLRATPDALMTMLGGGTTVSFTFAIPSNPTLSGLQFYNQAAVYDPTANAFGFVMSDAVGWIVGL